MGETPGEMQKQTPTNLHEFKEELQEEFYETA